MGLCCSGNHVQNPSKDGGGGGGEEEGEEEEEEIIESSCFFCACTACLNVPRTKKNAKHPSTVIASSSTESSSATLQSDHMMKSSFWSESSILSLGTSDQDYSGELSLPPDLRKFSFADLKAATRNFRPDSILGEGGFGCVFKGWIDEHTSAPAKPGNGLTVAVKILNQLGMQGHKEWMTEIIYLGQLRHPNLVRLFGFCIEGDHRLLVYEFMQRGSLNNHLFQKRGSSLPWNTRMKIMLGSARGVEFLHSRKNPIIYRDFKSSNILLDNEFEAKLSDFGLAKDGPQGNKSHVSTRVMGTEGYAAPEYILTGHLSVKSDVYSFGVVLLEILTGRPVLDENRPNGEKKLVPWALPYLNDKQKILEIVDPRLEGQYSTTGAQRLGRLSLRCLHRDPRSRPTMGYIVERLEKLQE